MFHTQCHFMFMVHPLIQFHPISFNGSLDAEIESKAEENIRTAPQVLVLHFANKLHPQRLHFFSQNIYYFTEHKNHKIQGRKVRRFLSQSSLLRYVFNNDTWGFKE